MRNLTCVAIVLALVPAAAPAMAQAVQPTDSPAPTAVQKQSSDVAHGQWMLLQGYGKDGEVHYTWYYVTQLDLSRYRGS